MGSNILNKLAKSRIKSNIDNYINKIRNKFSTKLYLFYENWILPPQNETLLELKRREFKERTKYLDPKVLYNLSEEEKTNLRDSGYFVDLDNKTIREIKNFKIALNRHQGKYKIQNFYYNFSLYNTKYYYGDQQTSLFQGDPDYLRKLWRYRSKTKRWVLYFSFIFLLCWINYHINRRNYIIYRQKIKNNDNSLKTFTIDFSK